MSATRRILAAGLPAAAALVFAASPALAMESHVAKPAVTASPCADGQRDKCDYDATGAGTADNPGDDNQSDDTPGTGATAPTSGGHTRGHGGYGTPAPTTPATPSPSAHVDTVPPTSTSPSVQGVVTPSPTTSTPGGGVSAGHALPVTGPSMGTMASVGGVMVALGIASVWYTRRRRTV
jgi:LPXTG-motif cell wall-anchored protein